jgi:hypothetical protein
MKTDILAIADALPDQNLLARLDVLAGGEREATVELVAHLAALDRRPTVYAAQGYGSLFAYCTQAPQRSEDATCHRIEAARACRRFPVILDLLASGDLTLTSVRLLSRHLTPENHKALLKKASRRSRRQIEALVAELAPQPDVPSSVRKLPTFAAMPPASAPALAVTNVSCEATASAPPPRVASGAPPDRPGVGAGALPGAVSPSGRRPTRSFGGFRRFCAARSRMVIRGPSSTGRSPC